MIIETSWIGGVNAQHSVICSLFFVVRRKNTLENSVARLNIFHQNTPMVYFSLSEGRYKSASKYVHDPVVVCTLKQPYAITR